jgi:hypothetical protein
MASRVDTIMIGKIKQGESQACRQDALAETKLVDKDTKSQQTVHNRRHRRQIADVDLDDVGDPVALCVFLKVQTGGNPERHGSQRRNEHHQQRTDPGRQDAGLASPAARRS